MRHTIQSQRRFTVIVVGFLWGASTALCFPAVAPAFADEPNPYETVRLSRVSLIEGELLLQRGDDEAWTAASVNLPLRPHDRLWATDGARSEVQFDDGVALRIAENTNVDLLGLERGWTHLQLTLGVASLTTPASRPEHQQTAALEIDTPQASLQVSPASRIRIDVAEDGSTIITVREGKATINRNEGPLVLSARQRVSIEAGDTPRYELEAAAADDDWDRWVDERATRLVNTNSREYLGPDLAMGASDLDAYGRWDRAPDYGWVWVPRVDPGWVPYHAGRWIWREPWGWTWVSYEPWGWLPYHYGRWIVVSFGWVWVPGPTLGIWAPGCVRFIYGPDWVAWVPLGPGEIYYYYPPLVSINLNLINARTRGAVIVKSRREFVGGHDRVRFVPPKDPITSGRVAAGPPPVVPARTSLHPMPERTVRPDQLPPRMIQRPVVYSRPAAPEPEPFDRRVKELRTSITKGRPPVTREGAPVGKREQPAGGQRPAVPADAVYKDVITQKRLPAAPPATRETKPPTVQREPVRPSQPSGQPSASPPAQPSTRRGIAQPSVPRSVEFGRTPSAPGKETERQVKPLYERPPKSKMSEEFTPRRSDGQGGARGTR
ncbi:MAG: FecR domain-containing protein [Nitrospirae bacterium]|nr:FecR domain-containing protein [Nitrospirota bacterium]